MESKLKISLRTATRDRKADITCPPDVSIQELLVSARQRWALPPDYEYVVRSERQGSQLTLQQTLEQAGILDGDVLEIQPLADAG